MTNSSRPFPNSKISQNKTSKPSVNWEELFAMIHNKQLYL